MEIGRACSTAPMSQASNGETEKDANADEKKGIVLVLVKSLPDKPGENTWERPNNQCQLSIKRTPFCFVAVGSH